MADSLCRVVDRRIGVFANELDGHISTPLKGNIGELYPESLLHHDRDNLVFLRGPGTAHHEFPRLLLNRIEVFFSSLVRGFRIDPEDEIVKGPTGNWCEMLPDTRNTGCQWGCKEVG